MNKIKIEIKWAVIFAVVGLVWMWLEKLAGLHDSHIDKHPALTNLFAVPAIIMVVLALIDKRKNFYSGVMSYKQGLITGLIITVFVALLSPLSQYITSAVITPEYFPNVIEYSVSNGLMTQELAEQQFNMKSYMVQGAIGALIMGSVTSAIVAIFTRRKEVKD